MRTFYRRRFTPAEKQLKAIAKRIGSQEDLEQALAGFDGKKRESMMAALRPHLSFEPV